jgi:hypothetical protein
MQELAALDQQINSKHQLQQHPTPILFKQGGLPSRLQDRTLLPQPWLYVDLGDHAAATIFERYCPLWMLLITH